MNKCVKPERFCKELPSRTFVPMSAMFALLGTFTDSRCLRITICCTHSHGVSKRRILPAPRRLKIPFADVESVNKRILNFGPNLWQLIASQSVVMHLSPLRRIRSLQPRVQGLPVPMKLPEEHADNFKQTGKKIKARTVVNQMGRRLDQFWRQRAYQKQRHKQSKPCPGNKSARLTLLASAEAPKIVSSCFTAFACWTSAIMFMAKILGLLFVSSWHE